MREAKIIIEGVELDPAQSMSVRCAVTSMLSDLVDPKHQKLLGDTAQLYRERLVEVQSLILQGTK